VRGGDVGVGIVIFIGKIAKLGRESWGVGHGSKGGKCKCMTGASGIRLGDISIRTSSAAIPCCAAVCKLKR
jgi:hypothetical protein